MIEIIALILLGKRIGNKAVLKGQLKGRWQVYLVLSWFGLEFLGGIVGLLISGDILLAALLGLAAAVGGYLLVDHRLNQLPDRIEDNWIDRIGKE